MKTCKRCKMEVKGAWSYCAWCGLEQYVPPKQAKGAKRQMKFKCAVCGKESREDFRPGKRFFCSLKCWDTYHDNEPNKDKATTGERK